MSQALHVVRGSRNGFKFRHAQFTDALRECLYDPYAGCETNTAGNLGEKYESPAKTPMPMVLLSVGLEKRIDNGY